MIENWTALLTEGLVAVLLAVTIAYCTILDRRLRGLKADRTALEGIVGDMMAATGSAERAIGALKQAVAGSTDELDDKLTRAAQLREDLDREIAAAKEAARRLAGISAAAAAAPPAPAAKPAKAPAPISIAVAAAPEPVPPPAPRNLAETVAAARSLAKRYQDRVQHGVAA